MARSYEEKRNRHAGSIKTSDLWVSLCVLGLLIAFALSGLAWDENWRKFVRVAIGFSAYILVLLSALQAYRLITKRRTSLPFPAFALAACAAELSSGWMRPNARTTFDFLTALAASFLIGGIHWLALRWWRPLRKLIVSIEHKSKTA